MPLSIALCCGLGCAADDDDPCAFRVCDLRDASCHERVLTALACVRVGGDTQLEVEVIDRAALEAEYAELPDDWTDEDEQAYRLWNRGVALLALMPSDFGSEDAGLTVADQIAAYYDPERKQIRVVRDGPVDSEDTYLTFVHETVHALQDAELDLAAYFEEHAYTQDRGLAARARIEGEAELFAMLALVSLEGYEPDEIDFRGWFRDWTSGVWTAFGKEPAADLLASSVFPYAWGTEYEHAAWDLDPSNYPPAVRAPPASTADVVFTRPGGAGHPNFDAALDEMAFPVLPPEYVYLGTAHKGAWLFGTMLERLAATASTTFESRYWLQEMTADAFSVFHQPETDEIVVVWRVRWSERGATNRTVDREPWQSDMMTWWDEDFVLLVSTDPTSLAGLRGAITWEALPDTESGMTTAARHRLDCERAAGWTPGCRFGGHGPRRLRHWREGLKR